MASIASKMWSKAASAEDDNGNKTFTDGYHIIDASSAAEARATSGLPRRNDPYETGSSHKVRSISVANYNGPTQWMAIVQYAVPPNGQFQDPDDNPLNRSMVWNVQRVEVGKLRETDAYRKRKINSAGDIFPPEQATYTRYKLTGKRYERFWNDAKSRRYEQKTNKLPFVLGSRTVLPYECLCQSIAPVGEYEQTADYILIQYEFEIATDERATPANADDPVISGFPFDSHYSDIGNFGWYTKNSKNYRGRFCRAEGTTASSAANYVIGLVDNVILDGTGKPKDSTILVCSDDQNEIFTPISNPSSDQWLIGAPASAGNVQSPYSTAAIPTWLYFNHQAISFAAILD